MTVFSTATDRPPQLKTPPKNLEEARKVLWLRNNPRPLGELYDEGYLNRSRLEWAAAKAYDPCLRQAAQILLKQLESGKPTDKPVPQLPLELCGAAIPIGITLEQARLTKWPFPPFRGQSMGILTETKQLSLKDLGYAAENAWDMRVRQAASVLMLVRLNQNIQEPIPSAGFVQVFSGGRSYAEARQLQIALLEGLILGGIAGFVIAFLIWISVKQATATHTTVSLPDMFKSPLGFMVLAVLISLVGLYFLGLYLTDRLIIKKLENKIACYRAGQEGENKAVEVILQTLDGNWTLFRNIQLPGRNKADLDAVLVGPSGVWVLEIKNFGGEYRNIGDRWEYRVGKHWKPHKKSPSRQAQNGAVRLASFLKADGVQQWVDAVVVWTNTESPLTIENPSVAVWKPDRLPDEVGNIWQEEKVPAATRVRIVEKLTKLCQRRLGKGGDEED